MKARSTPGIPIALALSLAAPLVIARTARARGDNQASVPLAEYRRLIADYDRASRYGIGHDEAEALRGRFQRTLAVALADGRLVTVENSREIDTLNRAVAARGKWKADVPDRARIALLNRMIAGGEALPARGDPAQQIHAILAMSEFKDAAAPTPPMTRWETLLQDIQKSIRDFLDRLLRRQVTPQVKPMPWLAQFVAYTLYFLAAVGALIGVYYLGRWALERLAERGGGRARRAGFDLNELSLADPLASSRQLAEGGDYRGALRLAYLAALQRLSRAGLLILQEYRTNWEYQRALRSRSPLAYDVLLPATRLFDEVWYGGRQATPAEYDAVVAAHDTLPVAPPIDAPDTEAKGSAGISATAPTTSAAPSNRGRNSW